MTLPLPNPHQADREQRENFDFLAQAFPVEQDNIQSILTTSLPSSATNGNQIIFDTGTAGVRWHFVYDDSDGTTYPWLFIGGSPLVMRDDDFRQLTNQTSYTNLPTDPMSLTLPSVGGDFDIEVQGGMDWGDGNRGFLSYAVGATAASDNWAMWQGHQTAGTRNSGSGIRTRHTGVASGATIAEKARTFGNYTLGWDRRRITIWPVRVG